MSADLSTDPRAKNASGATPSDTARQRPVPTPTPNGRPSSSTGAPPDTGADVPRDTLAGAPPGTVESDMSTAMSALLARNWWAVALRGVFAILFGIVALLLTGPTIAALVLLFSAYMLADGIMAIVSGVRAARHGERWGFFILEGIVDIAAGVIAFLWPGITLLALVALVAAWAIVSGGFEIGSAFRLKQTHGRWLLALGGILSVIFGVLVALAPIAGAIVLTWWLGAYALVFGILLLGLAFRLRRQRDASTRDGRAGPAPAPG
jgi:uncharacterized membrane protein HdeD (DUF308 family)